MADTRKGHHATLGWFLAAVLLTSCASGYDAHPFDPTTGGDDQECYWVERNRATESDLQLGLFCRTDQLLVSQTMEENDE